MTELSEEYVAETRKRLAALDALEPFCQFGKFIREIPEEDRGFTEACRDTWGLIMNRQSAAEIAEGL